MTSFIYNHGQVCVCVRVCVCVCVTAGSQSTRVMWTPPLRESFAMPFLFLQTLVLSVIIRY